MSQDDKERGRTKTTTNPFDLGPLQRRLGEDRKAAEAVLSAFAGDAPRQIERLRQAFAAGASEEVRLLAHTLKGSLLWIGADDIAAVAHTMELNSSGDSPSAAGATLLELSAELEQLLLAVRQRLVVTPD
jgi:HPt (histidine-containing phosphotransfer) domain-containing protein